MSWRSGTQFPVTGPTSRRVLSCAAILTVRAELPDLDSNCPERRDKHSGTDKYQHAKDDNRCRNANWLPHPAICYGTETQRMVRPSVIVLTRWALKKSSPRRGHLGRIHFLSASAAQFAANAWITSSSSASVTCGKSLRAIFNIIIGSESICHSTRIVRSLAPSSLPL